MFSKCFYSGLLKVGIVWQRVKRLATRNLLDRISLYTSIIVKAVKILLWDILVSDVTIRQSFVPFMTKGDCLNGELRPLLASVFLAFHGDSSHYSCLSWVSRVLGWGSEESCPRTLPRKAPRIQCDLNPGPLDLPVKHFTSEPCRTPMTEGE